MRRSKLPVQCEGDSKGNVWGEVVTEVIEESASQFGSQQSDASAPVFAFLSLSLAAR